jgi:hypothetical protein
MARAAAAICALALVGCSNNPYVIGRYPTDAAAGANAEGGASGASGAVGDAGADECAGAHAGAIVCSGFESALELEWPDTAISGDVTLERTESRAHSGSGSLHTTSSAAESLAVITRSFQPLTSGELHFRAQLYVPAAVMTNTMNLFFVGQEPSPNPPEPFFGIDFNLEAGAAQLFSPQWSPARTTGTTTIPRDRWFCFRARISISDSDGVVEVFVDDQLAVELRGVDTLPGAGVRRFRAGIDWSSAQEEFFEVFIDDLVVDTAPLDCG